MHQGLDALNQLTQEYLPAIEAELTRAVTDADHQETKDFRNILAYHMGWQGEGAGKEARGKRIRPLLVLLTTTAAGGAWEKALPAASAVELVHNFSLIHDDIEDDSPLRRGRPTVWKLWGIPQAINAGDAMFSLAHLEILRLEGTTSAQVALQAACLLQQTCLHLTQGQYLDLSYENRFDINLNDYWAMITGKTARLISTCTQLGSLIAGNSSNLQQGYYELGHYLGLAFQVQDDLLGIWGDAYLTGKSAESDLITGKKTLPVIYGLSQRGAFAKRWLQGPVDVEDLAEVIRLLENDGGRAYAEQMANQLTSKASQTLDALQPTEPAGRAIRQLASQLLQRHA